MLSHVAILVKSVDCSVAYLREFGFPIGIKETWDGEGTAEIYVGGEGSATLLLMEPIAEGAYTRAMSKRGPGLHHIGIDVEDVTQFVDEILGSGWLLHPHSLRSFAKTKTIWLTRPGVASLIEVHERSTNDARAFISKIEMPMDERSRSMMKALKLNQIHLSPDQDVYLTMLGQRLSVRAITQGV